MVRATGVMVMAATLAGCGSASAGEGDAATQAPVALRSGGWLIEGSEAFARSPFLRHEEACIGADNATAFAPLVVVGLLRKDMEQRGMRCTSPMPERTGNLVLATLSCSGPEVGTLSVRARGVISAERIDVRYDLDPSQLRVSPGELAKAEAEIAAKPASVTARRTGSCDSGASMRSM